MYENVLSTPLYNGDNFRKDHATLIGWATAPNGGVVYALNHHLTTPLGEAGEIVTLYAVWKADDTYTVRYDPNGGTGEVASIENVKDDQEVTLPENRKAVLDTIQEQVLQEGDLLQNCIDQLHIWEDETDPKTPYIGIVIWWLREQIHALQAGLP